MKKVTIIFIAASLFIPVGTATQAQTVWTKDEGNPVLLRGPSESWDVVAVGFPEVILDGSTFKMWYAGWDGTNFRIGYATSTDGVSWTKHASNPVIDVGPPGSWDDETVTPGAVIFDGSSYKMWYWGYDGTSLRTGYATSGDGIDWTKHASNPVLPVGPFAVWDWSSVIIPTVLYDGTSYNLWYDGANFTTASGFKIGYATSDPITGIADEGVVPEKYELSQNYPNPFNPVTVIRYSIPKAEEVSLVVYNLIGEEVAHLIDERKPAGSYTVKWNASDFASGIYFYRLQTGDFVQTRKMVLLK